MNHCNITSEICIMTFTNVSDISPQQNDFYLHYSTHPDIPHKGQRQTTVCFMLTYFNYFIAGKNMST